MSQSTIEHGVFLLLAAILAGAPSAAAASPCKQGLVTDKGVPVAPGIVLRKQQCDDPLYRAFVVEIDLETKGLGFFVTPYNKRRAATSKFAASNNAVVAVNGGFWEPRGGFTVSQDKKWPKHGDTEESTVIGFGDYAEGRLKVRIKPTAEVLSHPPSWMHHALTGLPLVLKNGKPAKSPEDKAWKYRHPRTAVGLSKAKDRLFVVVVDGRRKGWSWGLSTHQLGKLFQSLGADKALNLDGGRSSTMAIPALGGLINKPCTKKYDERNVVNHLAIVNTSKGPGDHAFLGSHSALVKLFLHPLAHLARPVH